MPYSVAAALQAVVDRADPARTVRLSSPRTRLVIDKDRLALRIESAQAGYVTLLYLAGGRLSVLFPNDIDRGDAAQRIAAGGVLELPRRTWPVTAAAPAGTDQVLALVSPTPRDFSALALPRVADDPLLGLDDARLRAAWDAAGEPAPALLAGRCAVAGCDDRWGAALLSLEIVAR